MELPAAKRYARRVHLIVVAASIVLIVVLVPVLLWLVKPDSLTKDELLEIMRNPPATYDQLVQECASREDRSDHQNAWRMYGHPILTREKRVAATGLDEVEDCFKAGKLDISIVTWRNGKGLENVFRVYVLSTVSNPGGVTPHVSSSWLILVDKDGAIVGWHGIDQDKGTQLN